MYHVLMKWSQPSRRVVVPLVIAIASLLAVVGYFVWFRKAALPTPDSPAYQQYVQRFYVGVAGLEAGRDEIARANLDEAVELIPAESAGWANRGLLSLRKNDIEQAAKDLRRAADLTPENGEIEALLGILAQKQGKLPEAAAHLRKAVAQRPRDLASIFALAEVVSKAGGPDSEKEYQQFMEQILAVQPQNLPVLAQHAAAAFRRNDKAALKQTLDRMAKLAPNWAPAAKETFVELRAALDKQPGEVLFLLQTLDNVLKAERGYSRDSLAIRPRPGVIGTPIQRFLVIEPLRSVPAAPDVELTFKVEPLAPQDLGAKRWDAAQIVWLLNDAQHKALVQGATEGGIDVRPGDAFKPSVFLANVEHVRRADADAPKLAFPTGDKKLAPSSAGLLAVDWDNDLRSDLVLAGAGGLRFWQQQADGTFVDVTAKTSVPADVRDGDYFGVWAADIEADGDLDIIAARRTGAPLVLRNNRDGTFKSLDVFPGVKDVRAFVWADFDADGLPDAALLDAVGRLHVFANDRTSQFRALPLPDNAGTFVALTAADANSDGVIDLIALRSDGVLMRISDQNQRQSWQLAELAQGLPPLEKGGLGAVFAADLDNNGALDLIVTFANETRVLLGDEQGKFTLLPAPITVRSFGVLDMDHDGRLDLLGFDAQGQPQRAINLGKKNYHWQTIWPLANPKAGDDRINSFALGGEVEVRAGMLVQKQSIHAPALHFGLGTNASVDVGRIVWPNGVPQWEFALPAEKLVTAAQRLSGSCPFLFTYDGTGMAFAGDFMWATPLGMFINGQNIGNFSQTTEWLKIPGSFLAPRDGYYDVRVQANLWEIDYFDQLALIVADHPPHTELHVDERFFMTPTPPRLHVTTPSKPVAQAWDHQGKDATELVRAIDGRYLDRAGLGRMQGVAQDHWVEIDLGEDAPREGPVCLIARGWLQPTNTSINVALSQANLKGPRPLYMEIPDGKDGWKVADPALGFPAGKNKTMIIRLDGLDGKGVSRRVRLRTSMEIYWDYLGYAVELDKNLAKLQRPETKSADLRYRGIVAMERKNRRSPELPVYDKLIHGPQAWRDLTGYYTRFGDVRELLTKVDDRYVIMNAGDEIAMQFPAPPAPPAGWIRDFIWECDGWTRDGDYNTRHGNSVLPLPAHGIDTDARMPTRLEDDPVYRRFPRDWRTYHTRYVTAHEFARGLWSK
jgi:Tfp pilus assembly protein PilF